jgi:hypothetical protein
MPSTMTYANRHRREIGDTSADYPDNNDNNDDETYQDSGESDDEEEPSDSEPSSSSSSDDDSDDDSDGDKEPTINVKDTDGRDNTLDPQRRRIHQPEPVILAPAINRPVANLGVGVKQAELDNDAPDANQGANADENPGVGVMIDDDFDEPDEVEEEANITNEHERFQAAEQDGRNRAEQPNNERPRRTRQPKHNDDFVYQIMETFLESIQTEDVLVTAQMSAKAGLKKFGKKGSDALVNELQQLIVMRVMTGCLPGSLTANQKYISQDDQFCLLVRGTFWHRQ